MQYIIKVAFTSAQKVINSGTSLKNTQYFVLHILIVSKLFFFSVKGQIIIIFGFAGFCHYIQFDCYSAKRAIDST